MATRIAPPGISYQRDWRAAFGALRKLLSNGDDTIQVFRIMRALNAGVSRDNYHRLLATAEGGRIAYARVELSRLLADPAYVSGFAPGTVGAAYRAFLARTGYTAQGLVELSQADLAERGAEHPYAWFGRRERDVHDIWHVLTGYQADEKLGEACLVGFSYAQTRGLGWAFIGLGAALKSLRRTRETAFARAVVEGYHLGRRAAWLLGEDYERLLAEPLAAARARLRIADPVRYRTAQVRLAELGSDGI